MVSCLKVMLNVLFAWNNNEMKAFHEHRKTHDLINKKSSCDWKGLVALWAYPQDWNRLKQKIKKLWRHNQPEVVIFWQNNKLHSATIVQQKLLQMLLLNFGPHVLEMVYTRFELSVGE
jgi:hypothetical protein